MDPVRVLQVVTVMNRGGLETMLMNYYRQIDRSKVQFDFMVHREEEGHYDQEIYRLGGRIFRMPPIRPGSYKKYFERLDEFFLQYPEYKVVHSHINENSSFVLRAAKRAGVPGRIAHSHLSDLGIDIKLPFRLYARFNMKNYPSDYFACSSKAGEWLFGKKNIYEQNITVLNNAIDVEDFQFDLKTRRRVRKELGLKNELVIGHVGRFNKQKNHDYLIDIFKAVLKKEPDSILLLVGDGLLKDTIERKVNSLGLSSKVRFLGIRNDISQLMQGMDLFLFPSLFEGLPVVLVEAQAAGLKCVVSDAITKESDITGRVEFVNLKKPIEEWVEAILSVYPNHVDTSELIRKNRYDTASMAIWLSKFYEKYYYSEAGIR